MSSRSAAQRWAESRERVLFETLMNPAPPSKPKEVPTLRAFAPRFVDGHARANRQKPSGIATKERILRVHLLPALGHRKLDTIKSEDVQRLKARAAGEVPEDGQQRVGGAERAAEEGGGVGSDRADAVHGEAAAGAERLGGVLRLRSVRTADRGRAGAGCAHPPDRAAGWGGGSSRRRDDGARVGRRRSRSTGSSVSRGRTGTGS